MKKDCQHKYTITTPKDIDWQGKVLTDTVFCPDCGERWLEIRGKDEGDVSDTGSSS